MPKFSLHRFLLPFLLMACQPNQKVPKASDFLTDANDRLRVENEAASRASWVHSNFITEDTTLISSDYNAKFSSSMTELAAISRTLKGQSDDENRMLEQLSKVIVIPAPKDKQKNKTINQLKSELEGLYGSGKFCKTPESCQTLGDLEKVLAQSRKPDELLAAWEGWHSIAFPMKEKYRTTVELGNEGARELGYKDMAELWRSSYDMKPEAFEQELDRLWGEIKPFYEQLHCYVRGQLNKKYGSEVVPMDKPIPAHLLGNMWAQAWDNVIDLLSVDTKQTLNLTPLLNKSQYDSKKMVKTAENFFVSLGMPELPASFYERSLFEKPQDREVVCHASAWHIDMKEDVRIKMCIEIDEDNFRTIHHELGHIYYYLAYKDKPALYQTSANDGFHEALGDTIELSITADYLKKIALLKPQDPLPKDPTPQLMRMALAKVAFLPFGLLIDKYRWQIFDGRTSYENYNKDWWKLREEYQGVMAPRSRPDEAFDAGAKYHIPGYTPYSRYFIAHVLQFQLHRSLCEAAGYKGPLHECSIYGNKKAGEKLWEMMKLGSSQPWPKALALVTGQESMDASALREYFKPLEDWLRTKNEGQKCGWTLNE